MKKILLSFLLALFACSGVVSAQKVKKNVQPDKPKDFLPIYRNPQVQAMFPGCEVTVDEYRLGCSQQKLTEYIKSVMKYPKSLARDTIEGMSFVSLVIDTSGNVSHIRIDKPGTHPKFDKEALRIAKTFNKMKTKWLPAMQNGKKVMSEKVIPVKFTIRKPKLMVVPPDEDDPNQDTNNK